LKELAWRLVTRRRRAPSISARVYSRPCREPIRGPRPEDSDAVVALPQVLAFSLRHRPESQDAGEWPVCRTAPADQLSPDVERGLSCFRPTPQGRIAADCKRPHCEGRQSLLVGRKLSRTGSGKMCSEARINASPYRPGVTTPRDNASSGRRQAAEGHHGWKTQRRIKVEGARRRTGETELGGIPQFCPESSSARRCQRHGFRGGAASPAQESRGAQ
jgi:hypothetical protein